MLNQLAANRSFQSLNGIVRMEHDRSYSATEQSFVHKVESAHRLGLCEAVHAEASLVWLNKGLIGMEIIEEKAGHSRILLSESMKAIISTFPV